MGGLFISIDDLKARVGTAEAPLLFDVRREAVYAAADRVLPAARWREHLTTDEWALPPERDVVVYCAHGHNVSQLAAARLRARGVPARTLAGGFEGWCAEGGPTILRAPRVARWVTRTLPKVDRIACPWLIRRFIDPDAEILFVAAEQVAAVAEELGAEPFDIEGAAFSHSGERCSFDTFLERFGIDDPALRDLAAIVRGADTGRPELAPEAAGLLAMSLGISAVAADDHDALARGFALYDALYAWRRRAAAETHGWPPARAA